MLHTVTLNGSIDNTIPTTVNIKDGLIIAEDAPVYKLDADIMRTLVNSSFGEGTAAVGDLTWLTGDGEGLVVGQDDNGRIVLQSFVDTIDLPTVLVAGVPESAPVSLYAQGYVDESTEIQYTDANNIPVGTEDSQVVLEMLKVERPLIAVEDPDNLNENLAYFTASGERITELEGFVGELFTQDALIDGLKYYVPVANSDPVVYELAANDAIAAWGTSTMVDLYIKVAKTIADKAGAFVIRGQGYKMGADADNPEIHKIGSGEVKSTGIVTVPAVTAPTGVDIELPELILPVPEANATGSYSFADDIQNTIFLNGEDALAITATAVTDSFGALQFTWKKKTEADTDFSNISENEVVFQTENSSELSIEEAGQYKVSVVSFLNGASADAVDSDVIIAAELAGKITPESVALTFRRGATTSPVTGDIPYNSRGTQSQQAVKLIVTVDTEQISGPVGTLEYQWYKQFMDYDENEQEVYHLEPIANATGSEYEVTGGNSGYFVPVIKNNYYGSVYSYQAGVINVVDRASN